MTTLIIDLSGNNPIPDFAKLHDHGVRGVYLKASEGETFVDPHFHELWARASRVHGLAVGSYHFARQDLHPGAVTRAAALTMVPLGSGHMGVALQHAQNSRQLSELEQRQQTAALEANRQASLDGARAEADHYIAVMRQLTGHASHAWRKGDLLPVLDFELGTPDHHYSPWRDVFQERVLSHSGHDSVLYTYPGFNSWVAPHNARQRRLWIADYGTNPSLSVDQVAHAVAGRRPHVPAGYTGHDLWQFTSKLSLPGEAGRVDASILPRGREGALDALRCARDG